jgi:pimeloyl-ACP methyl ester carboxylesterase
MMTGSLKGWMSYLDIAIPAKPADWVEERARIETTLARPERMKALVAMTKTSPADAGAQLSRVACPVLIIEGSADPDWIDPRAEADKIVADLADGLGAVEVIEGAGHYPHTETPADVLALLVPFLRKTLVASSNNA